MKNFSRAKIGFAFLGIVTFAIGTMFAFGSGSDSNNHRFGRGGFPPAFMFEKIATELGLNDEQKTQAKQILDETKGRIEPLREQLKQNRETAKNLGIDGNFDEAKVNELAYQQSETMKQLFVEKEKTKAQLFAILTPEQREKAKQMQDKFGKKMKGKFGRGFGENSVPTE